jgi:hypothetical protein
MLVVGSVVWLDVLWMLGYVGGELLNRREDRFKVLDAAEQALWQVGR